MCKSDRVRVAGARGACVIHAFAVLLAAYGRNSLYSSVSVDGADHLNVAWGERSLVISVSPLTSREPTNVVLDPFGTLSTSKLETSHPRTYFFSAPVIPGPPVTILPATILSVAILSETFCPLLRHALSFGPNVWPLPFATLFLPNEGFSTLHWHPLARVAAQFRYSN